MLVRKQDVEGFDRDFGKFRKIVAHDLHQRARSTYNRNNHCRRKRLGMSLDQVLKQITYFSVRSPAMLLIARTL
jgi:hypothetical protein